MYTISYFENILKKKKQFNMNDIAKMRPSFVHPYLITGKINRLYFINNIDKINAIRRKIMPYSKPFK